MFVFVFLIAFGFCFGGCLVLVVCSWVWVLLLYVVFALLVWFICGDLLGLVCQFDGGGFVVFCLLCFILRCGLNVCFACWDFGFGLLFWLCA